MVRLIPLLIVLGCSSSDKQPVEERQGAPVSTAPDVVLTFVTGLRQDEGSGAADAFMKSSGLQGRRFMQAYAQSPSPFASIGSAFTGRYVAAVPLCGLMLSGDRVHRDDQQQWCAGIPDDLNTLADVLKIYGYRTGFFTGDLVGAARLADGFDTAEHHSGWADAVASAEQWWADDAQRPRLMVVVLSDGEGDILQSSGLPRFPERKYQWLEPLDPRIGKLKLDKSSIDSAYIAAAERAGRALGALIAGLGTERSRWTVLGSTNGMSLTERGGFHESPVPLLTNNLLVDRTIRVPLLLSGPGVESSVENAVVELVDLFPTIAELAGAVSPAGTSGSSLRGELGGHAYAEFGDMLWVRQDDHSLTFRCTQHNATSIDPGLTETLLDPNTSQPAQLYSLYDVAADPMQQSNLLQEQGERFNQLRKKLISLRTGEAAVPSDSMTPDRLWALRMAPSDGYW